MTGVFVLRYDFDMFCLGSVRAPSELVKSISKISHSKSHSKPVLAVFRDQKTIDAVASAPPIVRLFLEEAGFGIKNECASAYDEGALTIDPDVRAVLVKQLSTTLSNRAMKKALARTVDQSIFNFHDFISYVVANQKCGATTGLRDVSDETKVQPRRPDQIASNGVRRRVRPV